MKKTIICNIPMKENPDRNVQELTIKSLPASDRAVIYPINAHLEETLKADDELKIILLVKNDEKGYYKENIEAFKAEFEAVNKVNAKAEYKILETAFSEEQQVHEQLMCDIVDEIEPETYVLTDITYGPKDLPIIVFATLAFIEKHLGCDIEHVIYGQGAFENGKAVSSKICDLVALLYMVTVTSTIRPTNPETSKKLLKSMISF